jgi:hypothetical protein
MNPKAANDNTRKTALTSDEAIDVWLRRWNGEFQHHIAAHYGVNQGRVNDVLKEKRHIGSRQAAEKLRKASA